MDHSQEMLEVPIAYNFPVSPNPFELLDTENNSKVSFMDDIEDNMNTKPSDQKNYMSAEQEKHFLKQFQKIMSEGLPCKPKKWPMNNIEQAT